MIRRERLFRIAFPFISRSAAAPIVLLLLLAPFTAINAGGPALRDPVAIVGFFNVAPEVEAEKKFLAVPDPALAREHLRVLTAAPHMAGTYEDKRTADYVAQKFRDAGLETKLEEYKVWMNYPAQISVDIVAPAGVHMHGPSREHVEGDPFQDDPRVVIPYSGGSPSGEVEADVVYANYGRLEDFDKLKQMNVDVAGKIVLVRYGGNYRGVKSYIAQERGAAAVIIYSDPMDDGYFKGDTYPKGRWRPSSSVQRGSIEYTFEYPGDVTTPGIASVPQLALTQRISPYKATAAPRIPTTPLCWDDARPILEHLGGAESPREWQGAMPFTYHVGPGPVRIHLHLRQDYQYRTIWNVIGKLRGRDFPSEMVITGNHRDAWVYGAVDPGSGTTAMLEAVHGIGELLKSGWRPRRTIVFASWDGEEHGLIGSTEFVEQHAVELKDAVAYFNVDVAVAGTDFGASASATLKDFVRDVTKAVPSPKGGSVYDVWRAGGGRLPYAPQQDFTGATGRIPAAQIKDDAPVGDLGSGSDYTPFLQHMGIPATDISSSGGYPYHSVFDNFAWFTKFADPDFVYEQQMARILGLEILRMANADVLPYDYESYGQEITAYISSTQTKAERKPATKSISFTSALAAARRFKDAGAAARAASKTASPDLVRLNTALLSTERQLLLPGGLPQRPWYRHAIYAPGRYTGYAAVVIPGVNEAVEAGDADLTTRELDALTAALDRAAQTLEGFHQGK
jgi:N-acetylated-alpha-linked acidic dipeptidase